MLCYSGVLYHRNRKEESIHVQQINERRVNEKLSHIAEI